MNRYYISIQKLGLFLENCKNIFANINHTHTISNITDISEYVDEAVNTAFEYTDNQITNQTSETWTFTLNDGSTVTKKVMVK